LNLLTVSNLTVRTEHQSGPINILDNLNFKLESGKSLGVVGESGCGKSMAAFAIIGLLLENMAASGKVMFGKNLLNLPEKELCKIRGNRINIVFPEPMTTLNPVQPIGFQVVMYAGRIVETGPTGTLFNHAQHPYNSALLEAVPRPDPSRKRTGRLKESASTQLFSETEGGCAYASRCPLVEEKCREKSPSLLILNNSSAMESDKNTAEIVHKVACYKPLDSVVSV